MNSADVHLEQQIRCQPKAVIPISGVFKKTRIKMGELFACVPIGKTHRIEEGHTCHEVQNCIYGSANQPKRPNAVRENGCGNPYGERHRAKLQSRLLSSRTLRVDPQPDNAGL